MIVFDLACDRGHVFEAWFGSTGDYDGQKARGLVSCPVCGETNVSKAVMAPRVSPKGNAAPAISNRPAADRAPVEAMKSMMSALADVQRAVLANSDYVGDAFAAEAHAIHLGESESRSIHGVATPAQARSLVEEGIDVAPLPFPVRPKERQH